MSTPRYRMIRCTMLCVAGLVGGTTLHAQEMPKRKPGLWDIAMQMEGRPGAMGSKHCVDAKSDEAMQRKAMAGDDRKAECRQTGMKRISGGVEIDAECKSDEGVTKVHSRVVGDMQSSYTIDNTMTFTPPRQGMSQMHMTMKATHQGACPADMKPGDVRLGGMTMNPGQGGMGFDLEKLKNMSPEERAKWAEQMKKSMGQ